MLNYNHLRYFWLVAKTGNLTQAAKKLRLSQSALSTQIKTLENQLEQALFERRGRNLVLTEVGKITFDYAESIFKTGNELVSVIQKTNQTQRIKFRMGALATLSRNFQMQFLEPLIKHPGIEIMIRSGSLSSLMRRLTAHELDVVLANQAPLRDSASDWVTHLISEQPVSLVGHSRFSKTKRSLKDLLANEQLVLPTSDSNIRIGFDALIQKLHIRPIIAAEVNDMAMLRLMALETIGLAIVPRIVVKEELQSGRLTEIKKLPELKETFFAITLKRKFPHPLLKKVL